MSSPIRCQGLSKTFKGTDALRDFNLEVQEGSIYALTGPNGAGKTTLIKILVNLLQPTAGWAAALDTNTRLLSPAEFAQIGYVSENQELPEWMTVEYFLAYLKPFYPQWDDGLAKELLDQFQLPPKRLLKQLSRGMKMKAALASSLAYHPRLILLDEPFSGLDPLVRDEFIEGLLERATETTIFVSSHDLAEIESFASHVGFLNAGRLEFSEETTSLTSRFREVEIVFEQSHTLPATWPESWLQLKSSAAVVRFVESQFDVERTRSQIAELFPGGLRYSVEPMSLREIFVALARAEGKAAA